MPMLRYILAGGGILACALVFTGMMAFEDAGFERGHDVTIAFPAPGGPYRVGRKRLDWIDPKRAEHFDTSRKRELMVWIWYPAASNSGTAGAEYVPGPWGRSAARWEAFDMRLRSGRLWSVPFNSPISASSIEKIKVHSTDNAPVDSAPDGPPEGFPVLLFSPGLGKMPTDYTAVIEDIVSYGYVVIGINPTYFVSLTTFADGRTVGAMPPWERIGNKLSEQFPIWVDDLRFVSERVTSLAADRHDSFARRLDVSRYGAFGHSYGGAAALAAASQDPKVLCALDWDGSPRGAGSESPEKPSMLLQSDHGVIDRDRASLRFYDRARTGYRLTIKGALHRGFSDEIAFPLPRRMRQEVVGTIEAARMIHIASAYTRAFFDTYLRNRTAPLLCGPDPQFPEVTVRVRGKLVSCESSATSIPENAR